MKDILLSIANAGIQYKLLTAQIPEAVLFICQKLIDSGFEAYIVGGCVRDLLIGRSINDWDITSNATPNKVMTMFPKVIPTGIDHGTVTVMIDGEGYEVTVFRGEEGYSDGRRPDKVTFINDINKDLERRDFTINAIAYDPINKKIIDPFGGIEDINRKLIKAVGNADDRFGEDALRTLRAARFSAALGFDLDEDTRNAIQNHANQIHKLSAERITTEIIKMLKSSNPSKGLQVLQSTYILDKISKELASGTDFSIIDGPNSKFGHNPELVKLSILLKDISPNEVENVCRRFKMSADQIDLARNLNIAYGLYKSTPTDIKSIKQSLSALQKVIKHNFDVFLDNFSSFLSVVDPGDKSSEFIKNLSVARKQPTSIKDLDISGQDLIGLGIKQGPELGGILKQLLNEIINNPELNTKDKLVEMAMQLKGKLSNADTILLICNNFYKLASKEMSEEERAKKTEENIKKIKELTEKHHHSLIEEIGDEYSHLPRGGIDIGRLSLKYKDHPEFMNLLGKPQPEAHHPEIDSLLHTLMVMEQAKKLSDDPSAWYAALTHDLGKGITDVSKLPQHIEHEKAGVPLTKDLSERLNVPDDWKDLAVAVTGEHLNVHRALEMKPNKVRELLSSHKFYDNPEKFYRFLQACEVDAKGRLGMENKEYPQALYLADVFRTVSKEEIEDTSQKGIEAVINKIKAVKAKYI
jgi:tRNA nucleotidyltransferase (CCA-adding enzyme)